METWGSQTFPEAKFSWGQGWDSGRRAGVRRDQGGAGRKGWYGSREDGGSW